MIKMNEQRSPIHVRLFRASSWKDKAKTLEDTDSAASFIYYWIAFNSLYGQPIYLDPREKRRGDKECWQSFLGLITEDLGFGDPFPDAPVQVRDDKDDLLGDRYLDEECWVEWEQKGSVTVDQRNACGRTRDRYTLKNLVQRLYVLRNQVFHGSSSDGSSKNRDTLRKGIRVLAFLIPRFYDLIDNNRTHPAVLTKLGKLPYPPSIGGVG